MPLIYWFMSFSLSVFNRQEITGCQLATAGTLLEIGKDTRKITCHPHPFMVRLLQLQRFAQVMQHLKPFFGYTLISKYTSQSSTLVKVLPGC